VLSIYAYDYSLQEGGYTLLSGNRPGIACLCHTTSQESLAARSGPEAPETGPLAWRDGVVGLRWPCSILPQPALPHTVPAAGLALGGAAAACQLNGGKATEIKL